jgi:hypothetical protein
MRGSAPEGQMIGSVGALVCTKLLGHSACAGTRLSARIAIGADRFSF